MLRDSMEGVQCTDMGLVENDKAVVHPLYTPPRKPPRLEGVVQNRGIKNKKKKKKELVVT